MVWLDLEGEIAEELGALSGGWSDQIRELGERAARRRALARVWDREHSGRSAARQKIRANLPPCARCDEPITRALGRPGPRPKYCSSECKSKAAQAAHEARERAQRAALGLTRRPWRRMIGG